MVEFLGKDTGMSLREHSIAVCDMAVRIMEYAGINDSRLITAVKIAALSHDIGKCFSKFQYYLKNEDNEQSEDSPRHNEISYGLLEYLGGSNFNIENDEDLRDAVLYSVLFHHTPYAKGSYSLSSLFTPKEMSEICEYYNAIYSDYGVDSYICLDINSTELSFGDIEIGNIKTLDFISDRNNQHLRNKKKLSYFELIFNVVRYADEIVSSGSEFNLQRYNHTIDDTKMTFPEKWNLLKWNEQIEKSNELYENNFSMFEAVPGYGKTICGIRYLLKSPNIGCWVCPDNSLSMATYRNIMNTLRLCGLTDSDIRVSLIINGKNYGCDYRDSDIIVMNIDTYLNGIFRNSRKHLSFEALFANTIFDEYHEYFCDSPIYPLFTAIMSVRRSMRNIKTMVMSGTAINHIGFIKAKEGEFISAGHNGDNERKKVRLHYISYDEALDKMKNDSNFFTIVPNVETTQKLCEGNYTDICFHALFDDESASRIQDKLFVHNGFYHTADPCNVSATSILSRGFDLSFNACYLINPSILTIEQSIGRICRWDTSETGDLYIVESNKVEHKRIYLERDAMDKPKYNRYPLWDRVYKPYIDLLKSKVPEGTSVSVAELKNIRKEYMANNSISEMTTYYTPRAFSKLRMIEMRNGKAIIPDSDNDTFISDKPDVRGLIKNRFFKVQVKSEPLGTFSGPIAIPSSKFGDEYNALVDDNIIKSIKDYFAHNVTEFNKYFNNGKVSNLNRWKGKNFIRALLDKAVSEDTPFPLLRKYEYTHELGFKKI